MEPILSVATILSSASVSLQATPFLARNALSQAPRHADVPHVLANVPSIGASPLSQLSSFKMVAIAAGLTTSVAFTTDTALAQSFPRERLAIPVTAPVHEAGGARRSPPAALLAAIKSEAVEDGRQHPAESALAAFVRQHGGDIFLEEMFDRPPADSALTVTLLRLFGRMQLSDTGFRQRLLKSGLASGDIQVRDAAVTAAEEWSDPGAIALLESHVEESPWLADYITRVVRDLKA